MKLNIAIIKTWFLAICIAILGILGYCSYLKGGLGFRLPGFEFEKYAQMRSQEVVPAYGSAQKFVDECDMIYANKNNEIAPNCYVKNSTINNQIFLWGDSYAQMLSYGIIKHLPNDWQLLQVASRGCQPSIFEVEGSSQNYCKQSNFFAMQTIAKTQPKVVIVSQNSNLNKENAQLFTKKLHSLGVKKVIFVGKPPQWAEPLPKIIFRFLPQPVSAFTGVKLVVPNQGQDDPISSQALGLQDPDAYISLHNFFCNDLGCQIFVEDSIERGITTLDNSHLTPASSSHFAHKVLVPQIIND